LNVCAAPLAEIGLLNRTLNSLEERGIVLIGELADKTRDDLENIPNFGDKTIEECCKAFDRLQIPHPNWKKRKAKRSSRAKEKSQLGRGAGRYPIRTTERSESGAEYYYVVGRNYRESLCAWQNPWKNAKKVTLCTLSRIPMRAGENPYRRIMPMRALLVLQKGGFFGCYFDGECLCKRSHHHEFEHG